jgi:hypothetical protein
MLTMIGSETPSDTRAEAIDMSDLAAYPTDRRIVGARCEEGGVAVDWDDGRQSRFHAVWLRDNCACSACRHPQAMERQFLLIDTPERIEVQEAQVIPGGHLALRFGAERPARRVMSVVSTPAGSAITAIPTGRGRSGLGARALGTPRGVLWERHRFRPSNTRR